MSTESQPAAESRVARMMTEPQANPAARDLFLRSALTAEERGQTASKYSLTRLEEAVADLVKSIQDSAADTARLVSMDVEARLHRRVRSRVSQALGLRRARIMQSQLLEPLPELLERMDAALADGLITDDQDSRVEATDVILRAERKGDGETIWVAIEASSSIKESDIRRARESADILAAMFEQPTEAAVVGYRIGILDEKRADDARVHVLLVAPSL